MPDPIWSLPSDITNLIFDALPITDLTACENVSQPWNAAVHDWFLGTSCTAIRKFRERLDERPLDRQNAVQLRNKFRVHRAVMHSTKSDSPKSRSDQRTECVCVRRVRKREPGEPPFSLIWHVLWMYVRGG
ncbi:hypothetical protein BDV18DRAFT_164528 [Aspergillus unguis]